MTRRATPRRTHRLPPTEPAALGTLPCLRGGAGRPLVFLGGLMPTTGVSSLRNLHVATLAPYVGRRTVHYVNRRPELAPGLTIARLAAEHAEGIRTSFGGPVDVIGLSTGGSIAQQLAADHPDVVRRLALLCTAHRLSPETRAQMRRIAARIRSGAGRRACALAAAELAPDGPWQLIAALAGAIGRSWLSDSALADLATTIELEDTFALERCARSIAAPTLLVGGELDAFYPVAMFERTVALIPDARLDLRAGHGHLTVVGLPEVQTAILDHLDG
jgi:pimeloyl-ACP methyl ester carboxylesterase